MKSNFFPFIKPTEQEFKDLWNDCVFTFDANILLNFYRYKTESTNTFFNFLNKLDERIFITYQACQEYFERRLDVISEQEKAYSEMSNALENTIESPLHNSRKHPYISLELLEELAVVSKKVKDELNARSKEYSQRLVEDDILNRIITIFDGKVGEAFSEKRLSEIFQEGDKRYQNNIPPGFKDKQKGGTRQYGDLVLWFQIIEFAKQQGKDIIFISDDAKEDWILSHKGRTIGLLPDLQKEFNLLTGKKIHLYNASRFTELASEFLDTKVSEETIKDIGSLQNDAAPVLEADLVWQSSGRFNNGFSQKNVEKYGNDPIPVGSPMIVYWQLDWRFALIIYNNSSYPAYNRHTIC